MIKGQDFKAFQLGAASLGLAGLCAASPRPLRGLRAIRCYP